MNLKRSIGMGETQGGERKRISKPASKKRRKQQKKFDELGSGDRAEKGCGNYEGT